MWKILDRIYNVSNPFLNSLPPFMFHIKTNTIKLEWSAPPEKFEVCLHSSKNVSYSHVCQMQFPWRWSPDRVTFGSKKNMYWENLMMLYLVTSVLHACMHACIKKKKKKKGKPYMLCRYGNSLDGIAILMKSGTCLMLSVNVKLDKNLCHFLPWYVWVYSKQMHIARIHFHLHLKTKVTYQCIGTVEECN